MTTSGKEQRLQRQIQELQQKWDLLSQKLVKLDRDKILAVQSDDKFRIDVLLAETMTERQQVEAQLTALEQEFAAAHETTPSAPDEPLDNQAPPVFIPFVGREVELRQLHQALTAAFTTKKSVFVLIQGDFGVGKTALAEHFLVEAAHQQPTLLIGQGKCALETESNGLIPFHHAFTSIITQAIRRQIISGSVLNFTQDYAPAWVEILKVGDARANDAAERGGRLTGRNQFSQENVFVQFTNALSRLAEQQPILMFIDDLHWADASSLGLIFHTARYLQDRAVLFLGTYRPVEAMETGTNAPMFREMRANLIRYGAADIELRAGLDVADYIQQRYPHNRFVPELIAQMQELTGGHALFVSQVCSLGEDTGVITSTPNSDGQPIWGITPGMETQAVIPPTLSAVLDQRIRLMSDELREMLTYASVEGEDFTAQVVARLRQIDEAKMYDHLETLEHRYRLIQEQGSKEVAATMIDFYRFAHRFFREHIYSQLSHGKRRLLHRQVGECLEALYHDDDEITGQLTQHFQEAHEPLKAAQYALRAAKFEQTRYAWVEAERRCEFGLTLLDQLLSDAQITKLRFDLLELSGDGYYRSGMYPDADRRYREALTLAQQLQIDAEKIADLCCLLSDACERKGEYEEMMNFIQQGKQILAEHGVPFGAISIDLELSWVLLQERFGNNNLAMQTLDKMLTDIKKLPQLPKLESMKGYIFRVLGIVLWDLSRYHDSIVAYQNAVSIINKTTTHSIAGILLDIADDYLRVGDINECLAHITKGQDIAQKQGDMDIVTYARFLRGEVLLTLGKSKEAVIELTEAIIVAEQINSLWYISHPYATLALSYLALSKTETAYQKALCAMKYAEKIPYQIEVGYALDALAQVEVVRQDLESAIQHFQRAIDIHQKGGHRHFCARTQRHYAEALLKQGKTPEAVELLQIALTTFQELHLDYEIVAMQKVLDRLAI